MQAAAENFQIAMSHLWSRQVIYPQTSDSDVVPGRGSRIPTFKTMTLTMWDGSPG